MPNAKKTNGTHVKQQELHGRVHQEWQIKYLDNGFYSISPKHDSSLYLQMGSKEKNGFKYARIWKPSAAINKNSGQEYQWSIVKNTNDGTYCFYNRQTDGVADVYGASTKAGTEIIDCKPTNGKNQKWKLIKSYGSGGDYRKVTGEFPLCWAYILFSNQKLQWPQGQGNIPEYKTEILRWLKEDHNITCRSLDAYNSPLQVGEYRIAFRMKKGAPNVHFIYQLSNGTWAGKDAENPSVHFDESTDPRIHGSNYWKRDDKTFYDSDTLFFALKREDIHNKQRLIRSD